LSSPNRPARESTAGGDSWSASALGGLLAMACLLGCGPRAPARTSTSADVPSSHLTAPPGSTLVEACTPTGPELCFNAIDDNCNGVIDEGCGEETGVLQFTIAWGASPADVNLVVVTPASERIPNDHTRSSPTGFHAARDCPGEDSCSGQSIEDVAFDGLDPPRGHYSVEITLADLHGADAPVKVRFGGRLGGKVVGFDVDLSPGDDSQKTFSFDLP
jgi:tRNA (guanosine-2'-O-)-methyltransferase